jgi:hypothetical protein
MDLIADDLACCPAVGLASVVISDFGRSEAMSVKNPNIAIIILARH